MAGETKLHPCQSCGACCASFRVEFDAREPVPNDFVTTASAGRKLMNGTGAKHQPSCTALLGRIGERVTCGIYEQRSSTCRNFEASYSQGKRNPRCDEARARHGLEALTPRDWSLYCEVKAQNLDSL